MPTLLCNCAILMVAGLFYSWRAYSVSHLRRLRTLRERVAYMLWMMAQPVDGAGKKKTAAIDDHGLTAARS
jgi:hypothetical protein